MVPHPTDDVVRLASRTLELLEREYPNSIRLTLPRTPDVPITPRAIHPAFYGCYDWHSAVHSHWQVVRALRTVDEPRFAAAARAVLGRTLTSANIGIEMEWVAETDFLSPALSEADLLRRVMTDDEFAVWLDRFSPSGFDALRPVTVVDPSDGQLAHWAGLNLSRSWMMTSIADALPTGHPSTAALRASAAAHASNGLAMASHEDYMISHWVPTFAVYLLTGAAANGR